MLGHHRLQIRLYRPLLLVVNARISTFGLGVRGVGHGWVGDSVRLEQRLPLSESFYKWYIFYRVSQFTDRDTRYFSKLRLVLNILHDWKLLKLIRQLMLDTLVSQWNQNKMLLFEKPNHSSTCRPSYNSKHKDIGPYSRTKRV